MAEHGNTPRNTQENANTQGQRMSDRERTREREREREREPKREKDRDRQRDKVVLHICALATHSTYALPRKNYAAPVLHQHRYPLALEIPRSPKAC